MTEAVNNHILFIGVFCFLFFLVFLVLEAYRINATKNINAITCQTERTGRAKVNNSATELFHNHLPTNATINIDNSSASICATNSLYISLRPVDISVIPSTPARHNSLNISTSSSHFLGTHSFLFFLFFVFFCFVFFYVFLILSNMFELD